MRRPKGIFERLQMFRFLALQVLLRIARPLPSVNEDVSSQLQPEPSSLPGEVSADGKPRLQAAKSRLTSLLQAVVPKRKTVPEAANSTPSSTSNAGQDEPEEPVRPVIGPDRAALFLNSAGNIVSAQPRCADFFGRQTEELNGLNFKVLVKPGFDQEISKVLTKRGPHPSEQSFYVLALRKDGSEFPTQLAFKFLPNNHGFCWTVLVQAPGDSNAATDQKVMKTQLDSPSMPMHELAHANGGQQRQLQAQYVSRIVQLEEDLMSQRQINEDLARKLETQEKSLADFNKGMRRMKEQLSGPAATIEQAEAEVNDAQRRYQSLEAEATGLRQERDDLQSKVLVSQTAEQQAQTQMAELAAQLERTSGELRNLRSQAGESETARKQLAADFAREREANKVSWQKAEALNSQLKKLQQAADQAETRDRESATRCNDLEKKAADLKKTADDLTRSQAAQQTVAAQSAQSVKEFEQELKRASADLTASKAELEKQTLARQKLEAENRNLSEANAKAKADLAKECDTNKRSGQKADELNAQLKKLQSAADQAEARGRESAARCSDLEKKAAELKKTVDDLTQSRGADQSAAAQSAQRVKELEQQLKRTTADLAASRTEAEKQTSAHQPLEAENRKLVEANAKAKADLAESARSLIALEKRTSELEQRVREGISSLAKSTAELQKERAEREHAEKCASTAATHLQQLNDKLNRQTESERANRNEIANLEKTIHDRGDALARASAALRKETKERHMAEKQLRLVSDVGSRLEANLSSLEEAKKAFESTSNQKDERLQTAERALAKANSSLEKQSTERRRAEGLLAETQRQLEKVSGETKVEVSRLQAALELGELQRKKLEGDLLRAREMVASAQRGQNFTLDGLRLELRQPVEDLRQSACRLLEGQVTDEQKRAAETMLEKALFLQLTLNATGKADLPDKKNGAK